MSSRSQFYAIIVSDSTFKKALEFKNRNQDFHLNVIELNSEILNNVGSARRILMNLSSERLIHNNGWIITTDADTLPKSNWLHNTLRHAENIDMVCGKIFVNTENLNKNALKLLKAKQKYRLLKNAMECHLIINQKNKYTGHKDYSGPSLAIRKHVYLAVNGIPPIHFLEDIELYKRVKSAGYTIAHDDDVEVETSGRLVSKTDMGLGSELNFWSANTVIYKVEALEALHRRLAIHAKIMKLFYQFDKDILIQISQMSLIKSCRIHELYNSSAIYEEMVLKLDDELDVSKKWIRRFPIKDIFSVNVELENYLETKNI